MGSGKAKLGADWRFCHPLSRSFRFFLEVQIPSQKVFGALGHVLPNVLACHGIGCHWQNFSGGQRGFYTLGVSAVKGEKANSLDK